MTDRGPATLKQVSNNNFHIHIFMCTIEILEFVFLSWLYYLVLLRIGISMQPQEVTKTQC